MLGLSQPKGETVKQRYNWLHRPVLLSICLCVFFVALSFVRTVSAQPNSRAKSASMSLSLDSSMTRDPEALACLISTCRSSSRTKLVDGTGMSEFELKTEECKSGHLLRVRNALAKNSEGPAIKPLTDVEEIQLVNDLKSCRTSLLPESDPIKEADEAMLRMSQRQFGELSSRGPDAVPAPQEPALAKSVPAQPAHRAMKATRTSVKRPSIQKGSLRPATPSATATASDCSMPPNFTFRAVDADKMTVFVEDGADFGGLTRSSCLSARYETDPRKVVETNPVEVTIPYCQSGKSREFSPSRYRDILNGKKRLLLGTPPDKDFLAACVTAGKTVGTALQARQRLVLFKRPPRELPSPVDSDRQKAKTAPEPNESPPPPELTPADPQEEQGTEATFGTIAPYGPPSLPDDSSSDEPVQNDTGATPPVGPLSQAFEAQNFARRRAPP